MSSLIRSTPRTLRQWPFQQRDILPARKERLLPGYLGLRHLPPTNNLRGITTTTLDSCPTSNHRHCFLAPIHPSPASFQVHSSHRSAIPPSNTKIALLCISYYAMCPGRLVLFLTPCCTYYLPRPRYSDALSRILLMTFTVLVAFAFLFWIRNLKLLYDAGSNRPNRRASLRYGSRSETS